MLLAHPQQHLATQSDTKCKLTTDEKGKTLLLNDSPRTLTCKIQIQDHHKGGPFHILLLGATELAHKGGN